MTTRMRPQSGQRIVLSLLHSEAAATVEGALRTVSDHHVEFWSRAGWRRLEEPEHVVVMVSVGSGQWSATGRAGQASKAGAVYVVLDHPLAPTDRRTRPRCEVVWPVTLMVNRRTLSGQSLDVSLGGVRFVPTSPTVDLLMRPGEWVTVGIEVSPRLVDTSFMSLGVVRGVEEDRSCRIEFVDMPQRMMDVLNAGLRAQLQAGASVVLS